MAYNDVMSYQAHKHYSSVVRRENSIEVSYIDEYYEWLTTMMIDLIFQGDNADILQP